MESRGGAGRPAASSVQRPPSPVAKTNPRPARAPAQPRAGAQLQPPALGTSPAPRSAAPRPSTGPRRACSESDGERAGSNARPPTKPFAPSACLRGAPSPAEPSHRKTEGDSDSSALPAGLERGKMGAVPAAFAGRVGVASNGLRERRRCALGMRTSPVLRAGGVPPPLGGDWVTFVAGAHARPRHALPRFHPR